MLLCALRWHSLVCGMGFELSKFQAIRLNLIGIFFNTIMPGVVGGDVIKAIYVCKGQAKQAKVPVLLTILLDRIVGLIALFSLSFVAILFNWSTIYHYPVLHPFIGLIFLIILGLSSFFLLVLLPTKTKENIGFLRWIYKLIFKISILQKIYHAIRTYKDKPRFVIQAICFAMIHQAFFLGLFFIVTASFAEAPVKIGLFATIIPLGIVTTAFPLAPGGLGIGHVAFEKLFSLIALDHGANIFNIVFFGQMTLNLLGAIPYLFIRNELAPLMKTARENSI